MVADRCSHFYPQVDTSVASLNHYDAFVYDDGRDLFVFVGSQAARLKHAKAFEMAIRIKDSEYHGLASVVAIEGIVTWLANSI